MMCQVWLFAMVVTLTVPMSIGQNQQKDGITIGHIEESAVFEKMKASSESTSAICPWNYTIDEDTNRIPQRILVAEITDENSICQNMSSDQFICEPIRRNISILRKTNCTSDECTLIQDSVLVNVGRTCTKKRKRSKQCGKKKCKRHCKSNKKSKRCKKCRKICQRGKKKSRKCVKKKCKRQSKSSGKERKCKQPKDC